MTEQQETTVVAPSTTTATTIESIPSSSSSSSVVVVPVDEAASSSNNTTDKGNHNKECVNQDASCEHYVKKYTPYLDIELKNQVEIIDQDDLLDNEGKLKKGGWARQPCLNYNPSSLTSFRKGYRLKEWNYYGFVTDKFYLAVAVANLGYVNNYQTFFIEFDKPNNIIKDDVINTSFVTKGMQLPADSSAPGVHIDYTSKKFSLKFEVTNNGNGNDIKHNIKIKSKKMKLDADITLDLSPNRESIVLVTPIGKENFYYNRKVNLIPVVAGSKLQVGDTDYLAESPDRQYNFTYGLMDWGRGCWDYSSFWLWSSAWGVTADGRPVGLNLGAGFGNLTTHTENCVNIDGRIHKLGQVDIKYNPKDTAKPWLFECKHGRFGGNPVVFTPFIKKVESNNFGIISSSFDQIMGNFKGDIILDDGEVISVDLYGFSEVHFARW
ncbi:hypothetical protein DFA_05211 [Cavenderia fasciculata]|uniref:DUF2804 domain-containing protein n=1 Tax=Cavenderia fasciculata TaxID=261658 RepID=F4PNM8_CACFS|nr:uncharacterized protein DFA_05211 [Cavenderia fasciculata]EGG23081.1 hypothetical protein DFA_05211 [Cavenderia fasciculata]|eukprot:XP_004360932.1 hypothetical protein DFA_05211 [Cavenderia fasciculata]